MHTIAQVLVSQLNLQPHPEGGYYRRMFESSDHVQLVQNDRYDGKKRRSGTAIHYLLNGHDFSAWHKLKSDELWFFHKGSVANIYSIGVNGQLHTFRLGDGEETQFQVSIPANTWFAAEVVDKDSFTFVSCSVMPGFEFEDFEMATREKLIKEYPQHTDIITRLTR